MAITFNNVTYGPGQWGVVYMFHHLGTVDFVAPDTIVVNGTVNAIGDTVSVSYLGGTYDFVATAYDSAGAIVFGFAGDLYALSNTTLTAGQVLTLTTDGPNDYVPHACFAAGTRILTRRGEIAVEDLAAGDQVAVQLGGGFAPVVWIGRQEVECAELAHPAEHWPLRVRAHAFGRGRPHRDLFLSPDHAVHAAGVLIPVRLLENGTTVVRQPADRVTYFHVELPRHTVLLAEGLPAESYLDTGNRADFAGAARGRPTAEEEAKARAAWAGRACAELVETGPLLAAVRAQLALQAERLGIRGATTPWLRLRVGGVDHPPVRDGDVWHFELPVPARGARLMSGGFVPAHRRPGAEDARCLGVPVARLAVDGRPMPLHHLALGRGWHRPEPGLRWTAGAAELPPLSRLSLMLAPPGAWSAAGPAA